MKTLITLLSLIALTLTGCGQSNRTLTPEGEAALRRWDALPPAVQTALLQPALSLGVYSASADPRAAEAVRRLLDAGAHPAVEAEADLLIETANAGLEKDLNIIVRDRKTEVVLMVATDVSEAEDYSLHAPLARLIRALQRGRADQILTPPKSP